MDYKFEVEIIWKDNIIEGDNPVHESNLLPSSILSNTEHVKFCVNLPGPSGKAKYLQETDSEPVPWGKGEKNREQRSEIDLKPYAYKL